MEEQHQNTLHQQCTTMYHSTRGQRLCLKPIIILFLLLCTTMMCFAESAKTTFVELKERRVYYIDVTASMTGYNGSENIWDKVTKNLNKAIDNIEDEDTEIIIKTFTDSNHSVKTIASEYATAKGKKKLKHRISELHPEQNTQCHTDIFITFNDFYKREIARGKVNYFFLMTDGCQYSKGAEQLTAAIRKWNDKTENGAKHIYGFYVMLCNGAQLSPKDFRIIDKQEHLWIVRSASVDINLIRPKKNEFVCNIRNKDAKRYIDIPMSGRIKDKGLSVSGKNGYCEVERFEIKGNIIRVYLKNKKHLTQIPRLSTLEMRISQPKGKYDFLLSNKVSVTCDNLTPWAKISIGLGILILLILLIWFLLIKPTKYRTFKKFRKQVLIKQNGRVTKQGNVMFTGARMVIFADQMVNQSILNRIFTGRVVTFVSPEFTSPITFKPTRNKKNAYMNGIGYSVSQSPIPRNGIVTITNQQLSLEITLN